MSNARGYTIQAKSGIKRKEATRSEMLAATRELLMSGTSVANLSIDRICSTAGFGRTTFYLHFADKLEIVAELAREQLAWRDTIGAEALGNRDIDRDTIYTMIDEIVDRWAAHRPLLAAIIELAEYDERAHDIWSTAIEQVASTAAEAYAQHWADDALNRPPDVDMLAAVLTWMWERSCHQIARDVDNLPSLKATLTEVIWRVVDYRYVSPQG